MPSKTCGNMIIGQSGGATAVINASLVGAFEAAQGDERISEIYGMHYGIEGFLKEDIIDLRQQLVNFWPRELFVNLCNSRFVTSLFT